MKNKLLVAAIIVVAVAGCVNIFPLLFNDSAMSGAPPAEPIPEVPVELTVACVGDIMVHSTQFIAQYDSETKTYNYDNNFQYIKSYIEKADLAICNVETTFGGQPYSGYPAFSSPDELAPALAAAGFDVASTANNHMMDRGLTGMLRTLDVLQGNGLAVTGSIPAADSPRFAMKTVKGVNVAVVSYTYETGGAGEDVFLNGSHISKEGAALINSFNYNEIDSDLLKVAEVVKQAKEAGAEIVAVYYHWGEEYQKQPNQWQRYIAEQTANTMPVDMIFGSHPHTLQPMELMTNPDTGKQIPVYYSLGNFISNQRMETVSNRYTEQGAIAKVTVEYMKSTGEVLSMKMDAVPTWVEKYKVNGKNIYTIVPLDENLAENEDLAVSGHLTRAKEAHKDANELLGIDPEE